MKAPAVDYVRPRSLTEAIDQLARAAGEARVIAGGQSLVAMMNLRIASPGLLIDIARLPELAAVAEDGDAVTLGACVTHCAIESPTARPTNWAASVYEEPWLTANSARALATDKAGALWLRANCSRARRSEPVIGRSGSFLCRLTPALLGQLLETAPEVYRIIDHYGDPGVK